MKVETDVWTVIEGELKEIKFFGNIFIVKKKEKEADTKQTTLEDFGANFMSTTKPEPITMMLKEKVKEKVKAKDQGKKIGSYNNNALYLNVYNDIKEWRKQGLNRSEIGKKIHEVYKPKVTFDSCLALSSCYIRFMDKIKPKEKKGFDKGKIIGSETNNSIYENPYNEVKEALEKDQSWSYIRDNIIKKYFPNYKLVSLNSMSSVYKRFIKKQKPKVISESEFDDRSIAYNVKVTDDDIKRVKAGINAVGFGYKPTFSSLMKKTEMSYNRLRGTLDVMVKNGIVKTESKGYDIYYRLKE